MNLEKTSFIKLALQNQALKFGEFTLKSGRISPYFFNIGLFYKGTDLRQLGQLYAQIILKNKIDIEHLFGPAYKGIPLVTATAIALAEQGKQCTVTFNRKEIKDHGEGGQLIGSPLTAKTAIIDDVITAGTAFREAQNLIKKEGGILTTALIALDRCEQGLTQQSAISEIKKQGIEVYSIITLFDLIEYLKTSKEQELVKKFEAYLKLYAH